MTGADANRPDSLGISPNLGYSPIWYAIEKKNEQIVQLLLAKGANPNAPGNFGRMPLGEAIMQKSEPIVRLLLNAQAKLDKDNSFYLFTAIDQNNERMVELFLDAGANPNLPGGSPFETPLKRARDQHNQKIIDLLLKFGAKE